MFLDSESFWPPSKSCLRKSPRDFALEIPKKKPGDHNDCQRQAPHWNDNASPTPQNNVVAEQSLWDAGAKMCREPGDTTWSILIPWNQKMFGWISLSNRIGKSQGFIENWEVALWTHWFVINWSHSNLGVIPQFQPQPSPTAPETAPVSSLGWGTAEQLGRRWWRKIKSLAKGITTCMASETWVCLKIGYPMVPLNPLGLWSCSLFNHCFYGYTPLSDKPTWQILDFLDAQKQDSVAGSSMYFHSMRLMRPTKRQPDIGKRLVSIIYT